MWPHSLGCGIQQVKLPRLTVDCRLYWIKKNRYGVGVAPGTAPDHVNTRLILVAPAER